MLRVNGRYQRSRIDGTMARCSVDLESELPSTIGKTKSKGLEIHGNGDRHVDAAVLQRKIQSDVRGMTNSSAPRLISHLLRSTVDEVSSHFSPMNP